MGECGGAVREYDRDRCAGGQSYGIMFAKSRTDHIPFCSSIDEDPSRATVDCADEGQESAGMVVLGDCAHKGEVASTVMLGVVGRREGVEKEFFATTTTESLFTRKIGDNEWFRDGCIGIDVWIRNRGGGRKC